MVGGKSVDPNAARLHAPKLCLGTKDNSGKFVVQAAVSSVGGCVKSHFLPAKNAKEREKTGFLSRRFACFAGSRITLAGAFSPEPDWTALADGSR